LQRIKSLHALIHSLQIALQTYILPIRTRPLIRHPKIAQAQKVWTPTKSEGRGFKKIRAPERGRLERVLSRNLLSSLAAALELGIKIHLLPATKAILSVLSIEREGAGKRMRLL